MFWILDIQWQNKALRTSRLGGHVIYDDVKRDFGHGKCRLILSVDTAGFVRLLVQKLLLRFHSTSGKRTR